jgi:hypothetical protein
MSQSPTLSVVTGQSYFGLRLPRFYASATEPQSVHTPVRPGTVEVLSTGTPPDGAATPKSQRPPLSVLTLPPTAGAAPSWRSTDEARERRCSTALSNTGSEKSSTDGRGAKASKIHFKLPMSFVKHERTKSESGSHKKSRKSADSPGMSPRNTEGSGTATKQPGKISVEPLPFPIGRALTHSVGYGRKIAIETDFEDSRPAPPPKTEPIEDLKQCNSKIGLFAKSKRYLKSLNPPNQVSKSHVGVRFDGANNNGTKQVLDRTSSLLQQGGGRKSPSDKSRSGTTMSGRTGSSRDSRRKRSLFSIPGLTRNRTISATSSIQDFKTAPPPSSTPEEKAMYVGGDKKAHFKLEISNPAMPNFLPSEAMRLETPPVPGEDDREDWTVHKRGFFFDYNAPPSPGEGAGKESESGKGKEGEHTEDSFNPKRSRTRMQRKHSEIGWYSLQMAIVEKQVDAEQRKAEIQEFDIPEHLLSSPLCPRNPKHRSKGKGTCIFHGKNRDDIMSDDLMLAARLAGVH